jgi:hypothetical protein
MDYKGRALIIDPDVFAEKSVVPLLETDMSGKSILFRFMRGRDFSRTSAGIHRTS